MKKDGETGKMKISGIFGSVSGGLGIAGLHNVCHVLCQGAIVFLAIFGITVAGMPLAFLQDYSLFFSIMGAVSASVAILIFYWTKVRCQMEKNRRDWFWLTFNFIVLGISAIGIGGNFI